MVSWCRCVTSGGENGGWLRCAFPSEGKICSLEGFTPLTVFSVGLKPKSQVESPLELIT